MLELIIFDLDGTLIDSKADIANSVNAALAKEGVPTLPQKTIESFVGRGMMHLIKDVIGQPSETLAQKVAQNFWDHYMEHLLDQTKMYPGVLEFLSEFPQISKAVVTNKPFAFSKKILEGLNIDHHFKWLIGGDSLPYQKPSPKMLDPIFQDLGHKPASLMVGDSQIDVDCGKAADILTCGVTYGFREAQELVECKPDFLIHHFSELAQLPCFKKNHRPLDSL